MSDTEQQQRQSQQDQQNQGQERGQYGQYGQYGQIPQSAYDQHFYDQIAGVAGQLGSFGMGGVPSPLGLDMSHQTHQIVQAYFDQHESARLSRRLGELWSGGRSRRMADQWALQQTTDQITRSLVPVVTQQVIQQLRANPDLVKDIAR